MNPEFQRNLTLEFSFARLIGMPLFLCAIFALTYLLDDRRLHEVTANTAMILYIFIVLFWGARQAAESIFDEIRNHTWDIQKTSAISAWSLTWGKLFGSTVFNWYGGLLCLSAYSLATPANSGLIGRVWIYALGTGLLAQSLSFLVSLLSLRRKQSFNSIINYGFIFCALVFFFPLILGDFSAHNSLIQWYAIPFPSHSFIAASLVLACAWSVIGGYRLLAEELQIRTLPWVWLLFMGFLVVYCNGFFVEAAAGQPQPFGIMEWAFAICLLLTYILILVDNNNPMAARRLWIYSVQEQWWRVLEEMPCWFISLLLLVPSTLHLSFFHHYEIMEKLTFYPIALFLLVLRDVSIILYFSYAANPKRALGLSLLFLTFLYWILPAIFIEMGSTLMAAVFLPLFSDNIGAAIIFAAAQVGVIGFLLFQRWQTSVNHLSSL